MGEAESFGRYELVKLVGSGGMAFVHLARQLGPEGFVKPCVLKRIAPEARRHDSVRRMFLEEARISALLNHPNIVQTFDYGAVDGVPYMALELIDGVNLAQFCRTLAKRRRWLPVRPAVDICLKLLDALQYAHEMTDLDGRPLHLVHRDVSPQNTLLSRQGVVKLADFGIARHDARDTQTRIGESAKGKPGYMAPEQAMGENVDGRADLFSVGILLTELVSARRVMSQNQRPVGVLGISERVRHLFSYRPEAPRELESVAQRLCALDPNHRPATAAQAAAELRTAIVNQTQGQSLEQFLKQVFVQHIPNDTLGAALNQGTSGSPSPPPAIATPAPVPEVGFGDDPTQGQLPMAPEEPPETAQDAVRTAWARPERPLEGEGTANVYDGWPKEFLPDNQPKLELVSRSATMDAMKYFAAEESEEVKRRAPNPPTGAPPSLPRPHSGGNAPLAGPPGAQPPPQGTPLSDPRLSRALEFLSGGDQPGPPGQPSAPGAPVKPKRKIEIPPVVPLALAGLGVVLLGLIIVSVVSRDEKPVGPSLLPARGQLTVTSEPANAHIFLDHQDTGSRTPKTIGNLVLDRPIHVAVRLPDHRSIPRGLTLKIPVQSGQTSAHFKLKAGRAFTIRSEPAGAIVTVNGERLTSMTPVQLEPIPYGQTATITLEQDGYLPHQFVVKSQSDAPELGLTTLERATEVDVLSEPPGAEVYVDGIHRGRTPLYDLSVPKSRRYRVAVQKVGFRRWRQRIRPRAVIDKPIVAKLTYLPFMSLPMTRKDRAEAKALQRTVTRLQSDVRKLKAQLRRAQRRLERLEASPSQLIGPIAEAQRNVDLVRAELNRRDEALLEAKSKQEIFRDQILLKAEMEN